MLTLLCVSHLKRTLPHGVLSLVPMLFAPIAWALSFIAAWDCNFLQVTTSETTYRAAVYNDLGNVTQIDRDVYFYHETYGLRYECRDHIGEFEGRLWSLHQNMQDSLTFEEIEMHPFNPFVDPDYSEQNVNSFRTAAAFAFLAAMIGGMAMLFLWLGTCIAFRRMALLLMSFGMVIASLFSFLTLIAFSAEMCDEICVDSFRNHTRLIGQEVPPNNVCSDGCRVAAGSGCAIAAAFIWLIAAIAICFLDYAEDDEEEEDEIAVAPTHEIKPLAASDEEEVEGGSF